MAEQHLPSYEVDFNSKVQQLRDITAKFERARRRCFSSKVQRFRNTAVRFEDWTPERIRLYRLRQRRAAWIERFAEIQRRKREMINCAEIAEYCSEESGVMPNEVAREAASKKILVDLFEEFFEENGRSQLRFLHPYTAKTRMTREWLTHLVQVYDDQTIINQFLAYCWMPRRFLERWLAKHRMEPRPPRFEPKKQTPSATTRPSSPPRFQVPQESRARISPEATGRAPEILISAPIFAPQLVVTVVDQSEVPSGIEPRVRVPTPQDGGEPRSLVQDSPLPSDECSDLNTQRNKGGRPPAVDWEALKDALREEIKIHGYPDPRNPPGWRGTKDAVEFAVRRLGKEGVDVSHRTIEDNVRRILSELKAASTAKPVSR